MSNAKLTKKDLRRFSARYAITAQACQSYEAMQGLACYYSMGPFLEEWYKDDPDLLQQKMQTHLQYFNCQVYLGAAITAAALAIEETKTENASELASSIKTSLMGPFAGIGDALFNTIPKVVFGAMTAYAAQQGNWLTSLILILICTPLIGLFLRQKLIEMAYYGGAEMITSRQGQLNSIREAVSALGVMIIGALVPSLVKVSTPLVITIGEAEQSIQAVLDGIFPSLLPIGVTACVYFGLTKIKGMNTVKMVWIMIIISMILALLGIIK